MVRCVGRFAPSQDGSRIEASNRVTAVARPSIGPSNGSGCGRPLGACAVEVLLLGDWRASVGEVGSWPESGYVARATLLRPEGRNARDSPTRHCAPRRARLPRRRQRPHPLDVQRAHQVPLAVRQASQAESSDRAPPCHPRARCAYWALPARRASRPCCVAASRAGSTLVRATCASMPRSSSSNKSGSAVARIGQYHRRLGPKRLVDLASNPTSRPWSLACGPT